LKSASGDSSGHRRFTMQELRFASTTSIVSLVGGSLRRCPIGDACKAQFTHCAGSAADAGLTT